MVSSTPVGSTRSSGSSTAMASSSSDSVDSTQPMACPSPSGSSCTTDSTLISRGARRTLASMSFLPRASNVPSSTRSSTKCATTLSLPWEVTITSRSAPASAASAATSSMPGVSTTGNSSLGTVLVVGKKRVPRPAAGTTAVRGTGSCARDIVHTITARRSGGVKARPAMVDRMATADKAALREQLLAARRSVADDVRAEEARALAEHIRDVVSSGGTVCAYVPVGAEPGSIDMLDALLRRTGRVLLPVARTGRDDTPLALRWGEYRPGQLVTGRYGLLEPAEPWLPPSALAEAVLVLVPALAVDRTGM